MADIKIYGTLKNVTNEPIANAEQIGNLATVATSGSYNDLDDKPTIPTNTSDLNNDSGFINKEDIAPVEEVTKSRNDYDSSVGVISFITVDGEIHYPSVKYGEVTFYDYESTVDIVFSNDLISLNEYEISVRGTTNTSVKSIQIKDGDNILYTAEQYTPAAAPCFRIKSLIKNSNGTYTAVVTKQPISHDYGYTTITFASNTLTIAPVGNPTIMTTSLSEYEGTITYLEHTELNTLHKAAITGSYNDLADTPNIPDITGKADKVSNPTNGNFAALDSNGNLTDSGHKHGDYQTTLVSGTNIKTINSTSIVGSGNLDVGTVTGVKINNVTKTPTNGTVDLGTVLTSTTSSVANGSQIPITSGGVYTALQSYLTTSSANSTYEKKMSFTSVSSTLPSTCVINTYYRITSSITSLAITLPSSSLTAGDTIGISFTADSSITTPTVSGGTIYKQDGWSNFFEANATYEIVALYDGGKWLVTSTKFNS